MLTVAYLKEHFHDAIEPLGTDTSHLSITDSFNNNNNNNNNFISVFPR